MMSVFVTKCGSGVPSSEPSVVFCHKSLQAYWLCLACSCRNMKQMTNQTKNSDTDSCQRALPLKNRLINKRELAAELGLRSTRIIDSWVRKKMIPVIVGGYRTRLFEISKVRACLDKFERKAIGQ